jgi:TP901 family phage tail tape measure protein
MAFTVSYIYQVINKYTGPLQKIAAATDRFRSAAQPIPPLMDRMQTAMNGIAGLGVGAFLVEATKKSLALDDAMQDLAKNVPAETIDGFKQKFRDMSIEMGKSAVGLAQIAYEGSKMGLAGADLEKFTTTVAKVSTAFEMSDQAAGEAIGSINAKLGISVDQVTTLMARVNFLADNFTSDGARMIEIIQRTSGTMATLKMPDTLVAGLASFADTLETSPELAASGLNMMFGKMMQNKKTMAGLLANPQKTIAAELEKYKKMDAVKRAASIFKDYGSEAGRFVLKAVEQSDQLNKMIEKSASSDALASLDKEFQNRLGRASNVIERVKAGFEDMMVTIGDSIKMVIADFGPLTVSVMQSVRAFMQANPVIVKASVAFMALLAVVGVVGGVLAVVVGSISLPIIALAAAIATAIALYPQWEAAGHPVVAHLQALWAKLQLAWEEVGKLTVKILELFGVSDGANFDWVDAIGRGFVAALLPLQVLLDGFRAVIGAAQAVSSGDFSGAADAIKSQFFAAVEDAQSAWAAVTAPMGAVAPTTIDVATKQAQATAVAKLDDAQFARLEGAVKAGMESATVTAEVSSAPAAAPLATGANAPTGR